MGLLYFLNEHNQRTEGVEKLLKEPIESFSLRKPKKQNIYRMLAMNPRVDRKEEDPPKVAKKNTAFQNIKRILSRTEDEKHEMDVRILHFEWVSEMLAELEQLLQKEKAEARDSGTLEEEKKMSEEKKEIEASEPKKRRREVQIEEESSPEEAQGNSPKNGASRQANQRRAQEIFERHFKAQVDKIKSQTEPKIRDFLGKRDRKTHLMARIRRLRVLDAIYDSNKRRKKRIVDNILRHLTVDIVRRLRERVLEKLAVLRKVKAHLLKTTWKSNLINNYYKSLDVRSGSLQQNEKIFLSPKYFVSNLVQTEKAVQLKERWRYWARVCRPEVSLSSRVEPDPTGDTQKSELVNQSATLGGEEGMYDSLLKISAKNLEPGETERNLTHEHKLVLSEVKPGSCAPEPEKGWHRGNARRAGLSQSAPVELADEYFEQAEPLSAPPHLPKSARALGEPAEGVHDEGPGGGPRRGLLREGALTSCTRSSRSRGRTASETAWPRTAF